MQANPTVTAPQNVMSMAEKEMIYQWVLDIPNPETREKALLELRYYYFTIFRPPPPPTPDIIFVTISCWIQQKTRNGLRFGSNVVAHVRNGCCFATRDN